MKRLIVLTCVLFVAVQTIYAQQNSTLQEGVAAVLNKVISEYLAEKPSFGFAVAVVDDKQIIWEKTFGCVDGKASRPIDANTIFSIQSMSKSFTALAVLMAMQDGLVELDTPINKYLPDFKINSFYDKHPEELITLRLLLNHKSGIPFEAPFGNLYSGVDQYDLKKHIESLSNAWLKYPVGYRLAYSNAGIDLAAYIVQIRSGMPLEKYVKEKILDPLGMNGSSLDMNLIEKIENRAIGHQDQMPRVPLRIPEIGAGRVYTNLTDMAKYLQFHINKGVVNGRRILREDLIKEMHTIQFAWPGQRSGYCLALVREPVSNSYDILVTD